MGAFFDPRFEKPARYISLLVTMLLFAFWEGVVMERISMRIYPFLALLIVAGVLYPYFKTFGFLSGEKSDWGAFGDFFGGTLNPLFALLAFLAVLHSLRIQMNQTEQLALDKRGEEILAVIKDIDERLDRLMTASVGRNGTDALLIHHMIAESERGKGPIEGSDAYAQFVSIARQTGTMVEATVREIRSCVVIMHDFTLRYPRKGKGQYAPIIDYYILKTSRVVTMLRDVGGLPENVCRFYPKSQVA